MMASRHLRGAACLVGAALALGTAAEAPERDSGLPNASTLMLAAACANCHGTDAALRDEAIPAIAGIAQPVLQAQLLAFKQGQLPATVMDRIAGGFSDDELAALAAHFAAQAGPATAEGQQGR